MTWHATVPRDVDQIFEANDGSYRVEGVTWIGNNRGEVAMATVMLHPTGTTAENH